MDHFESELRMNFKGYQELMSLKVREILLVSSPYDAFIIEEDGSLASRIINEYQGLNLSMPPRVIRTSSAAEALKIINSQKIDLVITMPHLDDMDVFSLGREVKKHSPDLPVMLLAHSIKGVYPFPEGKDCSGIDRVYIWSGNSDLLLALVKSVEDRLNVDKDTGNARMRVLILVEDSPIYRSIFLPILYKVIVRQTQTLMIDGINEEHRLLKMRARPKILVAESYEEALALYRRYRSYLLSMIADTRFSKNGRLADDAGIDLLKQVKEENPELSLLMMSSEPNNRAAAEKIPAVFLDKNSGNLPAEVEGFFLSHLGFGDFVFRLPDGTEVDRAANLLDLELKIPLIPDESLWYHAGQNHFSNWIMARAEISLATEFRGVPASDFDSAEGLREYIISGIRTLRKWRQKGVVAQFNRRSFDAEIMEFVKIGQGSLGGKGRSLAFMSGLLQQHPDLHETYEAVNILIPRALVISTEGFESFVKENRLAHYAQNGFSDQEITASFLEAPMPEWLLKELRAFLSLVWYPLSVRSSSLLEDAHFQPYAGLYETYMIPNNHPDLSVRLRQLTNAIKRVYASTYLEGPRHFSQKAGAPVQEEAMAVIVQELAGNVHGDFFYPTLSGVAQSHNFYPFGQMKPEEGIAAIAMGFGRTVVEGEKALRFSPRYPQVLPQFSSVDDTLKNSQSHFYALKVKDYPPELNFDTNANLEKRAVADAQEDYPVRILSSTYSAEEHRLRDSGFIPGPKVLTFAQILKYGIFPLPQLVADFLEIGRKGMGCPVEIEFSANLSPDKQSKSSFCFLQIRPMVSDDLRTDVEIGKQETERAFCRSAYALGNAKLNHISDIVFIKPDDFDGKATLAMAEEIKQFNAALFEAKRTYLLVGPGRWGSSDRWLGIPVRWRDVSAAGAIIELRNEQLKVDPSQGSHFFHNITALGIPYITLSEGGQDFIDWSWLNSLPPVAEGTYVRRVRLERPLLIKVDGRSSRAVILKDEGSGAGGQGEGKKD